MWIGEIGRSRGCARGRGSTDRNDLDRISCPQPFAQMRQRDFDPYQLGWNIAPGVAAEGGRQGHNCYSPQTARQTKRPPH
jgi:hypothetical protein